MRHENRNKSPAAFRTVVKTRAESRTIHSVRDGGTETVLSLDVHVLQGSASIVELAIPAGVEVLEASGAQVQRWETGDGRLALVQEHEAVARREYNPGLLS